MKPIYKTHFSEWPGTVFLGSEKNPSTKLYYDYWLVKTTSEGYSWVCKHGNEDNEYGSGRIDEISTRIVKDLSRDFTFGIERAKFFSILYLATKRRPLLGCSNEICNR
jgi:hypothetical protein